jgi:hypothetical protein
VPKTGYWNRDTRFLGFRFFGSGSNFPVFFDTPTRDIKKFVAIRRVANSVLYAWANKPKKQDEPMEVLRSLVE